MGCDIHAYVEYKETGEWRHFASLSMKRNYGVFACMANVRNSGEATVFEAKGIPDDLGWTVASEYLFYIDDEAADREGYCTKMEADLWVRRGDSVKIGENRITRPDWHSASWLSLHEVFQAHANYMSRYLAFYPEPSLSAIIALLEELRKAYDDVRLVFWFDN